MTLLIPTSNNAAVVAAPLPSDTVAAQRPPCDSSAPNLLAATVAPLQAFSAAAPEDRDAVVWLSEHIATLDRVIYPVAARHLHGTAELRAQQAATHRLALLVRRLHAQIAGDGAAGFETRRRFAARFWLRCASTATPSATCSTGCAST